MLTSDQEPADGSAQRETIKVFKEVFDQIEERIRYLETIWGIDDMKQCMACVSNTAPDGSYSVCNMCNDTKVVPAMRFHKKKLLTSMFRRLIPMGVATGGVWTMNLRALRHIMALRTSPGAEEEISRVMHLIGTYMMEQNKILFADFKDKEGQLIPDWPKV